MYILLYYTCAEIRFHESFTLALRTWSRSNNVTSTSSTGSHAPDPHDERRYPRPLWFRILGWLLIRWLLLLMICILIYVLPAIYFHTLLGQLLFLLQHWWTILLTLIALII